MERILVLVPHEDRSNRAVTLAAEICQRTGASLVLLRVLEERSDWPETRPPQTGGAGIRELLAAREEEALGEIASQIAADVRDVEIEVAWGVPWEIVIGLVEARGIDLVVKPAWGIGPDSRVFFGMTALHLFHRCQCPVWVVGDQGVLPTRILAAIDPTPGETKRDVAQRILGWSRRVADLDPSTKVEVASAWDAPLADLMRGQLADPEVDAYVQDIRERARAALDEVLEAAGPKPAIEQLHFIEGPARQELPELINSEPYDLVVMGTLGRDGVAGKLMGETAEWILRMVRTSVLTVPPPRGGVAARA